MLGAVQRSEFPNEPGTPLFMAFHLVDVIVHVLLEAGPRGGVSRRLLNVVKRNPGLHGISYKVECLPFRAIVDQAVAKNSPDVEYPLRSGFTFLGALHVGDASNEV